MGNGENRVCPRCGTKAGDSRWCSGCGLNLEREGDLPTPEAYAATQREREWLEKQREEKNQQTEKQRQKNKADRARAAERRRAAASEAAKRRAEQQRRIIARLRPALPWAGLAALLAAAVVAAWSLTDYDAPVLGQSPVGVNGTSSATDQPLHREMCSWVDQPSITNVKAVGVDCATARPIASGSNLHGFTCSSTPADENHHVCANGDRSLQFDVNAASASAASDQALIDQLKTLTKAELDARYGAAIDAPSGDACRYQTEAGLTFIEFAGVSYAKGCSALPANVRVSRVLTLQKPNG